jgi:hypothetical protein
LSKELKKLVGLIKAQTGKNQGQIADEINYSRAHFNVMINGDDNPELEKLLRSKYKKQIEQSVGNDGLSSKENIDPTFFDLIHHQSKILEVLQIQSETANKILHRLATNVEEKIVTIDSNLKDVQGRVDSLKLDVYSGRTVVLRSLARLEKKPENTLLKEADNIIVGLLEEQTNKQGIRSGRGKRGN